MNLRIFESLQDLSQATARLLEQRLTGRDRAAVGLSGGSTPLPLYELLGRGPHRERLAAKEITWVVVDERYVPLDDPQSNAGMMQRTLFREGIVPGHRFLRFRTELNDPPRTAEEFDKEWTALGLRALDIVVLGVGEDGHTASLFPGTAVLEVTDRIAAAVFAPGPNQWRVTLTLPVIRAAGLRIVQVAGATKAAIVREAREGKDLPIVRATAGAGETWWLIDRAAAGSLSQST